MRYKLSSVPVLLLWLGLPIGVAAQGPEAQAPPGQQPSAPGQISPGIGLAQDPAFGGIPTGQATDNPIRLSLSEAIARGLQYNLAGLLGQEGIRLAEAGKGRSMSRLLPNLSAGIAEAQQQVNLRALGFGGFPGIPTVVGPFSVFDTRLFLSQAVVDLPALRQNQAASEQLKSAQFSYRNTRDRVVFVCGDLYLQAVAGRSRIAAAHAQLDTAQQLYGLAVDLKQAGVAPGIEVLRAQVELQTQQQRLIVAENEHAKQKLNLARAIGLPLGQQFDLADELPYAAFVTMTLEQALEQAYRDRADYQSALAQVRAAEAAKKAAQAVHLPSFRLTGDYGFNGPAPGWTHGSYTLAATIQIPIYQGGEVRARVREEDSRLKERQAELADLKGRIYYEIRTAFLNLQSADENVKVAGSAVKLAQEQLSQAQDRFSAGVASNIEVVEAQEAVANATEAYISSLYAHNIAKGRLAQTLGAAESSFLQFVRGNP
jgi:outer membrane protein TolC